MALCCGKKEWNKQECGRRTKMKGQKGDKKLKTEEHIRKAQKITQQDHSKKYSKKRKIKGKTVNECRREYKRTQKLKE